MAYRFRHGESVPDAIRRVAREELRSAVRSLTGRGAKNRDEAVHEARKSVKKLRALLRLVQSELDESYGALRPWVKEWPCEGTGKRRVGA